jgi:hypothetical protein
MRRRGGSSGARLCSHGGGAHCQANKALLKRHCDHCCKVTNCVVKSIRWTAHSTHIDAIWELRAGWHSRRHHRPRLSTVGREKKSRKRRENSAWGVYCAVRVVCIAVGVAVEALSNHEAGREGRRQHHGVERGASIGAQPHGLSVVCLHTRLCISAFGCVIVHECA